MDIMKLLNKVMSYDEMKSIPIAYVYTIIECHRKLH